MTRLQKVIADAGVMSRRAAESAIAAGRVTIDGRVARLGDRLMAPGPIVELDGIPLPVAPNVVSYLLNKPTGYLTTVHDERGRPTVIDLVPAEPRVFPVGRLDLDTEGLLLLTNDGDLALKVTHPRYGITKTYQVVVEGRIGRKALTSIRRGVELEDGPAKAESAKVIDASPKETLLEIVMVEGRKHEVKRLLGAIGHPVERLVRVAIGPIRDSELKPGKWRRLSGAEIVRLLGGTVEDSYPQRQ